MRTTIEAERGVITPGSDRHLTSLWTSAGMIETDRPLPELHGIEAQHQAIIAEPAAVALFGFAIGTLLVGLVFGGAWPTAALIGVVPALLWFAGVGQFIGGLFSLARGSTMGATAFCSFGMGYIIAATFIWMQAGGIIPATSMNHQMLAIGLFCFAYIAAMLAVAALRANSVYLLTLLALVPGYALAGVQQFGGPATIGHIGGWFLVAAALLAFYAAGAVVVNSQWCREVLPMGMRER